MSLENKFDRIDYDFRNSRINKDLDDFSARIIGFAGGCGCLSIIGGLVALYGAYQIFSYIYD